MLGKLQAAPLRGNGPLYLQIASNLRREIANGNLEPGARMPSIPDFATQLGVSVITVRQALEVLEGEGLLQRVQGRGTFVAEGPKVGARLVLRSDWDSLLLHLENKKPTLLKVADEVATPLIGKAYGDLAKAYRFMRRVHSYDGLPYALINIYLAQDLFDLRRRAFTENMVISQLAQLPEARIKRLRQRVNFTTADAETAEILKLPPNSAIGDVLRVITDEDDRVIYVGETKYRGDFVSLDFDIQGPPR